MAAGTSQLDVVAVGLLTALQNVLNHTPGCPTRPQEFSRLLGVNKDIASRLYSALRNQDPLAGVNRLPGSTALRHVLIATQRHGAPGPVVNAAEEALRAFDQFVHDRYDDRAGLDAAIGAALPGARRKFEATSKQTMYRGACGLKGVTSDVMVITFLAFPNATDPTVCDTAVVNGFVGLRRVRPGATMQFASYLVESTEPRADVPGPAGAGPLLAEFCDPPEPPLTRRDEGRIAHYTLEDRGVGPQSAVNLFTAEYYPRNHPRHRNPSKPGKRWFYGTVDHPTKLLVLDVLIHEAMWPSSEPELRLYDTIIYGNADPNDPRRDKDRLDLAEVITTLGTGLDRFRCEHVPRYRELLAYMFGRVGQDGTRFRGYRCGIAYPFYGSQACVLFTPPDAV